MQSPMSNSRGSPPRPRDAFPPRANPAARAGAPIFDDEMGTAFEDQWDDTIELDFRGFMTDMLGQLVRQYPKLRRRRRSSMPSRFMSGTGAECPSLRNSSRRTRGHARSSTRLRGMSRMGRGSCRRLERAGGTVGLAASGPVARPDAAEACQLPSRPPGAGSTLRRYRPAQKSTVILVDGMAGQCPKTAFLLRRPPGRSPGR
jgi:hypothetical protein